MSQILNLVTAYDTFVKGCKADGIWDSIKACCIMSGWDGLNGALTPLKGAAPTNFNFVSDDYDRKTGLVGDGSTKYLNSNYTLTSALQNNRHLSLWVQTPQLSNGPFAYAGSSLATSTTQANNQIITLVDSATQLATRLSSNTTIVSESANNVTGFQGISRSASNSYTLRAASNNNTVSSVSIVGDDNEMWIFARNNSAATLNTNSRLSFYSIGASLDLAALDSRVSTLMNDINFAMEEFEFDIDANAYILAIEAADGQSLEAEIRVAIDTFIKGCKADGIWDSIKSSCILAGARTLQGALVPLKGTAPTNFNFVSGDYDRKIGLLGNGTNKYLDSNRNNNADPQNDKSVSNWVTVAGTLGNVSLGSGGGDAGATTISAISGGGRNNCSTIATGGLSGYIGLSANSRSQSSGYTRRVNNTDFVVTQASQTPQDRNIFVFATNFGTNPGSFCNNRMSFYHIGEALNLAALDSRVSTLMTTINSVIP